MMNERQRLDFPYSHVTLQDIQRYLPIPSHFLLLWRSGCKVVLVFVRAAQSIAPCVHIYSTPLPDHLELSQYMHCLSSLDDDEHTLIEVRHAPQAFLHTG